MNTQYKAILESYGRSFIVAVLAVISTGETSLKAIALGGLVAVAGPAIRALNPNDATFGLVADRVDAELKKAVKKTAKKAPVKK
jgi:ribosomal protein L30E